VHVGPIDVVAVPARHASGRALFDQDATLWAGYALVGAKHRVYFSGDTGAFAAMKDVGAKLGPFDLSMIEVGQYHRAWPDWHIGPERAVAASVVVDARKLLPIHWGLFALAYHGWTEPIERVLAAALPLQVDVETPRPAEAFEADGPTVTARWWPEVPWQTAAEAPVARPGERLPWETRPTD
jgi:L-ascorbate metabolism protein UlaG (beta-lactamase superfamily)